MSDPSSNVEDIFLAALELESARERFAFLDEVCTGNPELRRRVERLLEAQAKNTGFLEAPAPEIQVSLDQKIAEVPGAVIGPYKLIEQIGEGGMGTVWMAQQTEPIKRLVAIKLVKAGMDSRQVIARFEAERQALALMDHANIARVLDAGTTKGEPGGVSLGRPYFVMDLVKGVPITKYCDEHQLTPRQRLELFIPVCQALQHAHQKGIIHRDLKPSNVLVGLYDGKPVPKVIDFGVAKAAGPKLTEATLFTGFGTVIGTPEYMSPEQARLDNQDIDTRSDIYSLGVLLYELLTGTTPFTKKARETAGLLETLRVIREQEPPKPSTKLSTTEGLPTLAANRGTEPAKLRKMMRGELDWIVMKALEKDRNRRYETAGSLSADVQRYLHDEPVRACPPSTWYRFRKFARRNRRAVAAAAAAALVVVLGVAGLATSTLMIAHEQQATQTALEAETRAKDDLEKALVRERRDSYFDRIALAHRELSVDNLAGAVKLLDDCPRDLQGWEWHYLQRLCRAEPVILQDKTEVNSLAFSPINGELIASAGGDGAVKVWNIKTRKVIQAFDAHPDAVFSVAFHPDGNHLASVGTDRRVKVWDWPSRRMVFDGPCETVHIFGTAYCVAFSPDGRQLAAGSDGAVQVWDWRNRQLLHPLAGKGKEKGRINVAFSRNGRRLASGSSWGSLNLWDPEAGGEPLCTFPESGEAPNQISALSFNPDGGRLATASFGRSVDVWDTTTGKRLYLLRHGGIVLGVAYSPDGRRLASVGEDKTVHVWEATTRREVLGLRGHSGLCGCVAFSPDGWRLASASVDRTIRVWDATPLRGDEWQETVTFSRHSGEVWSVAVDPDGQKIASAGWRLMPNVRDARTGQLSVEFTGHTGMVFCVAWQPDGRRIASAGLDGESYLVRVWDAQTGGRSFELPREPTEYFSVAFSPDGRYLVTGRANGTVQVWDARTGAEVGPLGTHDRRMPVRGVAFSPDGRHLASASDDGKVKLWDATRLQEEQEARHTLSAQNRGRGLTVAFSPDGRRLVTGSERNTAKIWDVQTGRELETLHGHTGDVYAVAFSPDRDGRWVASGGEDSSVKVWDSRTGKLLRNFRGHLGLVSSVAFIPGGTYLVSGSRDHTVKVWDLTEIEEGPDR